MLQLNSSCCNVINRFCWAYICNPNHWKDFDSQSMKQRPLKNERHFLPKIHAHHFLYVHRLFACRGKGWCCWWGHAIAQKLFKCGFFFGSLWTHAGPWQIDSFTQMPPLQFSEVASLTITGVVKSSISPELWLQKDVFEEVSFFELVSRLSIII